MPGQNSGSLPGRERAGVGGSVKIRTRLRAGEGLASDLLPGASSGGRGGGRLPDEVEAVVGQVLRTRYLTRQRRTVASVCREITRECKARGLRAPSRGTVLRRIARLDPVTAVSAREGADAARALRPAGGTPPEITGLLEQVQADHTLVDVIVVDERHRLPVGRPYVTAGIGVAASELLALCEHVAVYAGFPRALNALEVVDQVLTDAEIPRPASLRLVHLADHETVVAQRGDTGSAVVLVHALGLIGACGRW